MIRNILEKWADVSLKKRIRELEKENDRLQEKLEEYRLFVEKALERLEKARKEKEEREIKETIEKMEKQMEMVSALWKSEEET